MRKKEKIVNNIWHVSASFLETLPLVSVLFYWMMRHTPIPYSISVYRSFAAFTIYITTPIAILFSIIGVLKSLLKEEKQHWKLIVTNIALFIIGVPLAFITFIRTLM